MSRPAHHPAGFALGVAVLLTGLALVKCLAGCAALPAIEAAAPVVGSIVSLITAEAQKASIPPGDPAFQAALAGAQALEARQADAGAVLQAELDSILLELHRGRKCSKPSDGGVAPISTVSPDAGTATPKDGGP